MDKFYIAQRLKKYLFFISIIFVVLTTSHLIYSYIYSDAKKTAVKWGSITEGIIGKPPSLNPLKNKNWIEKYINSILYRSLLTYDVVNKKIVPDLAKCDTTNLLKIECFLEINTKWSNWDNITYDDILSTFKVLKTSKVNPVMNNILKNIEIEKTDISIIFKSSKKDIDILKIFFQPIVSEKILNIISKKEIEGNFSLSSWIYSGKYKIANILKDELTKITTIILEKNKQYSKNNVYIENILLKFFPTKESFLKNKNTINIFNDTNNLITREIPKFWEHKYVLPQYVNVFLNTRKLVSNDLRGFILNQIDRKEIIKELWTDSYKEITNPFIENIYIEENNSKKNIADLLEEKNYYKHSKLKKILEEKLKKESKNTLLPIFDNVNTISWEVKIIEKTTQNKKIKSPISIQNPKSKIIISPNWVDKYNFITRNKYTLELKVKENVDSIFINNKKIENFIEKSNSLKYTISENIWNLKLWLNKYKIEFYIDWKKELIEEVYFYLEKDKEKIKQVEKDFFENKKIQAEEKVKIEEKKEIINKKSKEYIILEKQIEKLKELDENYFYNNELSKYSLELYYVWTKADIKLTAENIKENLKKEWIETIIRQISTKDLKQLVFNWKKNYDIILIWVNLSYFNFNIYPYYHSSQIKKGYNFSNFRKLDLDIVLEELKWNILNKNKRTLLQNKALTIIKNNNLSKTLYTPIFVNFVDKNIKWYILNKQIPEELYRFNPIYKSYVKQEKTIIFENKSFTWYIKFILNILF